MKNPSCQFMGHSNRHDCCDTECSASGEKTLLKQVSPRIPRVTFIRCKFCILCQTLIPDLTNNFHLPPFRAGLTVDLRRQHPFGRSGSGLVNNGSCASRI